MPIRVLLADDHPIVRDGLLFLLAAQPDIAIIGSAANGREAVQAAQQLHPDIIVMDIAMPELNGIEATTQIGAASPATQVIMLSMHSTVEHVYRALQAGARGYLLKEAAGIEVAAAVRAVHAGHRYLSQRIDSTAVEHYLAEHPLTSPLESLSQREREILQMVVEGHSSAQIAAHLHLSAKTVETYRSRLMKKLQLDDLPALVKFAVQHGLTPLK